MMHYLQESLIEKLFNRLKTDNDDIDAFKQLLVHFSCHFCKRDSLNEFAFRLLISIMATCGRIQERNICPLRYPKGYTPSSYQLAVQNLLEILENIRSLSDTYARLQDPWSRGLLIEILAFRVLGPRHMRLSTNTEAYWRHFEEAYRRAVVPAVIPTGFAIGDSELSLDLCEWSFKGRRVRAYCLPLSILNGFILEQYAFCTNSRYVGVEKGDYVIDAGACWGDSALYFASLCGSSGRVFSFEILPFNLSIIEKNLRLNSEIGGRIEVMPKALWSESDKELAFHEGGPGSSIRSEDLSLQRRIQTTTLDDFVKVRDLHRVDFIKMDIEGAELEALHGAEKTLKLFKPKLAICVYHKKEDLSVIPAYLERLGIGYQFYLGHFSIHAEETVLFAKPAGRSNNQRNC